MILFLSGFALGFLVCMFYALRFFNLLELELNKVGFTFRKRDGIQ
jgi:hypothetical protein